MKLRLADYHLEACRLVLAEGGGHGAEGVKQKAQAHLAVARKMIEQIGYGRTTEALPHGLKTIPIGE